MGCMCKLYIIKLDLTSDVVGIVVPSTCYINLMKQLISDDYLLKTILRKSTIIGEVDNVDPTLSGLALINEGPYGNNYSYIEFVRGVYIPLKSIRPVQCFLKNDAIIGCKIPKQQVYIDCKCEVHKYDSYVFKNDVSMRKVISLIKSYVRPHFKSHGKYLWLYSEGKLFYWLL